MPEARKIAEELGPLEIEAAPSVSEIADVALRLPRVAFAKDEPIDDAEPPELSPQASYDKSLGGVAGKPDRSRCCVGAISFGNGMGKSIWRYLTRN